VCISRTNGISLVDRAVTTNVAGSLFVLVLAVFLARLRGARNVYRPSEWTGASSTLYFSHSLFRREFRVHTCTIVLIVRLKVRLTLLV